MGRGQFLQMESQSRIYIYIYIYIYIFVINYYKLSLIFLQPILTEMPCYNMACGNRGNCQITGQIQNTIYSDNIKKGLQLFCTVHFPLINFLIAVHIVMLIRYCIFYWKSAGQKMFSQNLPVERKWVEFNTCVNYLLKSILNAMVNDELIHIEDEITKFCISWFVLKVADTGIYKTERCK